MLVSFGKLLTLSLLTLALLATPALAAAPATACGGDKTATPGEAAPENAARAVIPVKGMSCGGCAGKIQAALAAIDGVVEATVDVAAAEAQVTYDASRVTVAMLVKAIEEAGYSPGEPALPKS